MDKKKFLVVIDTTESTRRRTLPRGILNTYVILALDAFDARNILLRMFNATVINEVSDSIYVYDLNEMDAPLTQIDEQKAQFPGWSFIQFNGARPQKQSETPPVVTQLGNQTLSPTVNPQQARQPVQQRPVAQQPQQRQPISAAGVSHSPRSREFRGDDGDSRPTESRQLTEEQRRIIAGVGALSTVEGADEGTNLRVNSNAGLNTRQSSAGYPPPITQLDPQRAELLKGLIPPQQGPEIVEDADLQAEIMEQRGGAPLSNSGLDQITEQPLSADDIKRMNEDLEKFK